MQDFGKMDDDQLLRAAHGLAVEAQAAKARADEAKREIRRRFHGHRILYSTTTNLQAAISYPRKLHEEEAKALLTEDELARISVGKLDSKLAKERLRSEERGVGREGGDVRGPDHGGEVGGGAR